MHWIISFLLLMTGCTGYRYTQQENPLAQYGIQSLSVPMFFNYSNQPEVSGNFTRETFRLLSSFRGLKLKTGYDADSDAVLIGIIKSPDKIHLTLRPNNLRVAQKRAEYAIGDKRQNFYIPGTTEISLYLQIIVIKKPTNEELALLKSGVGEQVQLSSRIIFNETIPLRSQFAREVFDNGPTSDATSVTATQNAGLQRKALIGLSEQAAISVRDLILYAF
jgi:hypothetical protein